MTHFLTLLLQMRMLNNFFKEGLGQIEKIIDIYYFNDNIFHFDFIFHK